MWQDALTYIVYFSKFYMLDLYLLNNILRVIQNGIRGNVTNDSNRNKIVMWQGGLTYVVYLSKIYMSDR